MRELAECTFLIEKHDECLTICNQLIANPSLPESLKNIYKKQVEKNCYGNLFWKAHHPSCFEGSFKNYGKKKLDLIAKFLPHDPIIIEAGAHYGEDTVAFAKRWPQAKIISFEPNPEAYKTLDSWCKENNIDYIDFMWLDLEGMEFQVLRESKEVLKKVKVVHTETNFQEFRKNTTQYAALRQYLENLDFVLLSHWFEKDFQGNAIFIKKELYQTAFMNLS